MKLDKRSDISWTSSRHCPDFLAPFDWVQNLPTEFRKHKNIDIETEEIIFRLRIIRDSLRYQVFDKFTIDYEAR